MLTAALQDNKAASVVGADARTLTARAWIDAGRPLGDPPGAEGAVAVTVARYATPSGGDLNGKGVAPDRVVPAAWPSGFAAVCWKAHPVSRPFGGRVGLAAPSHQMRFRLLPAGGRARHNTSRTPTVRTPRTRAAG